MQGEISCDPWGNLYIHVPSLDYSILLLPEDRVIGGKIGEATEFTIGDVLRRLDELTAEKEPA